MSTIIDRLAGVADGLGRKAPVRFATTGPIVLSGLQLVDGGGPRERERILVWKQLDPRENGFYAASTGPWIRTADFDGARDVVAGTSVMVNEGDNYALCEFIVQAAAGPILPGATPIQFAVRYKPVTPDGVAVGPFLSALEASGAGRVATVQAAVPSDPGSPINRAFVHATTVRASGVLASFVRTTLGLSDAQLAAVIAAARELND